MPNVSWQSSQCAVRIDYAHYVQLISSSDIEAIRSLARAFRSASGCLPDVRFEFQDEAVMMEALANVSAVTSPLAALSDLFAPNNSTARPAELTMHHGQDIRCCACHGP
jgi:hypothetical protein